MKKAKYGFALPQLFKSEQDYFLIAESGMNRNYALTHLQKKKNGNSFYNIFTHTTEALFSGKPYPISDLPMKSTWKVIIIGNLETIIESNLITDLAQPIDPIFKITDTDWIIPGISGWDWLNDSQTNGPDIQKIYIDKATEYGWKYVLKENKKRSCYFSQKV